MEEIKSHPGKFYKMIAVEVTKWINKYLDKIKTEIIKEMMTTPKKMISESRIRYRLKNR